jgi:uncharacterized protein (TIGR03086 family)
LFVPLPMVRFDARARIGRAHHRPDGALEAAWGVRRTRASGRLGTMRTLPDAAARYMGQDRCMVDEGTAPDVGALIAAGRDREAAQRGASTSTTSTTTKAPHTDGGTMGPLEQLDRLGPALGGVVANITPAQLDRATPCADFTVRGVLEHMIGGATAFAAAYRGEVPAEPDLDDVLNDFGPALGDLVTAVSAPGALDGKVAAPFGEVDGEPFARFIVLDGLVHGWDLATATGQSYDPPAEVVAAADAFARQALDPLRDGQTFATAVEPEPGATPSERLAAYTGRRTLSPR